MLFKPNKNREEAHVTFAAQAYDKSHVSSWLIKVTLLNVKAFVFRDEHKIC